MEKINYDKKNFQMTLDNHLDLLNKHGAMYLNINSVTIIRTKSWLNNKGQKTHRLDQLDREINILLLPWQSGTNEKTDTCQ